jgi:CHASE2 domain-containing sensor protein
LRIDLKKKSGLYIGAACALAMGLIYLLGFFELAEYQALDFLFKARGEGKINPDIVIIEIDDKSLDEFGRWPWTRGYHAAMLDILEDYDPKVVVFDILFSEPQIEHPEEDKLLAYQSKKIRNILYAAFFDLKEDKMFGKARLKVVKATMPLPELMESSKGAGFVNILVEPDGKVRKMPLLLEHEGKACASLDALAAAYYLGKDVTELNIPTDKYGMMWLNYAATFKQFKRISFSDIARSFDQIQKGEEPDIDLNILKGKLILIGLTATGAEDFWSTSVSPLYPGIGIRAASVNMILQRDFLRRIGRFANFIVLLMLGISLGIVVPKRNPFQGLQYFAILAGGLILLAIAIFDLFNLWMALATPLILISAAYLAITLNQFIIARFEKGLIEQELKIASRIQESILPQRLPMTTGVEVGVKCVPAKQVGGDFYDFIRFLYDVVKLKEDRLGIVIGDVSGKGVPAALFMAKVMADFRGLSNNFDEPSDALTAINDRLTGEGVPGMFVTLQYLIYEPKERKIKYSNGGHNPLIWVRNNGEANLLTQDIGSPIGIIPDSEFKTDEIIVSPGDIFIMYTDGISEARNIDHKEFEDSRILETVKTNRNLTAQNLAEKLVGEVEKFSEGMPQHDDMTIICLKIT